MAKGGGACIAGCTKQRQWERVSENIYKEGVIGVNPNHLFGKWDNSILDHVS